MGLNILVTDHHSKLAPSHISLFNSDHISNPQETRVAYTFIYTGLNLDYIASGHVFLLINITPKNRSRSAKFFSVYVSQRRGNSVFFS